MRRNSKARYVGDFETTVFDGQEDTKVWASALVKVGTENVEIFHSIDETWNAILEKCQDMIIYYHNLKFDGSFWLNFLEGKLHFKQAYERIDEYTVKWLPDKEMPSGTYKYGISDMGMWYTVTICTGEHIIELRDSLKLLPFSVKAIGESFKTKHKKLDMKYEGYRFPGCVITEEEKKYIANDVLVVKEALEFMFSQGHDKLTIGSCCMAEFKSGFFKDDWNVLFPDLYQIEIDEKQYGSPTAGDYIRHAYKGGWCYLVKGKENRIYRNGTTADVNSLYPSMMSSESGNRYPVGRPAFWKGNFIPDQAKAKTRFYYVRIKTRFFLKPGKLPFIQIKGDPRYKGTECLETSSFYVRGQYVESYIDRDGILNDSIQTLTLTMMDFKLLKDHYNLQDFEILDGCYFAAEVGIFDKYIEKWKRVKLESTGAMRSLAKLFLNSLYGKTAANKNSSFKVAKLNDERLTFTCIEEYNKKPGYIAIGAAITSYARNFTIRAAQKNYHGRNRAGFIYADTDSIHCDLPPDEIKGVTVHDKNFCCWKLEICWDQAIFARQKTYIEHVTHEDLQPIEKPYYNIKAAGMPKRCKELLNASITGILPDDLTEYKPHEVEFMKKKRYLDDFKRGLVVPGKLIARQIPGGVLLMESTFEML